MSEAHPSLTVLIVDDNQDAADSLAILIEEDGHQVSVAYDSETGLDVARKILPQVIFHDIGLPIVDGYAAAARLRGDPLFARTILVALTAYGSNPDRNRSLAAGFDFHIVKPIHFEEVQRILELTKNSDARDSQD